jgi:hypothetical protein
MGLPTEPVTIRAEEIGELHQKLSTMRHDINNQLSLVMAAIEILRRKPESQEKMLETLLKQPMKISQALGAFSVEFDKVMGITRP